MRIECAGSVAKLIGTDGMLFGWLTSEIDWHVYSTGGLTFRRVAEPFSRGLQNAILHASFYSR
jgi:hypothetical protein